MSWFKVTDTLMGDPKVLAIPAKQRAECLGVWLACGVWCAQQLTDGRVSFDAVTQMFGATKAPETLVKVGLWRKTKSGYTFVNWAKYQPLRSDVERKRKDAAERVRKWRERQSGNAVTDALVTPPPTRPVPSRPVPISNSPLGGNLPKQGRAKSPAQNPCGGNHDPADACGACGSAREQARAQTAQAERDANRRRRDADKQARLEREAEAAATIPATPEQIAAIKAKAGIAKGGAK